MKSFRSHPRRATALLFSAISAGALSLAITACGGGDESGPLTVYSGREEEFAAPLFADYEEQTGTELEVRYGDSAELAATMIEEGENSPADVFFSQDAGALGALEEEGLLAELDQEILTEVDEAFRSRTGAWVGTSGRARVIAYDTRELSESELPDSVLDLTEPEWKGRVGWAPTNGSFQAFVTALRIQEGDDRAQEWLEGMVANDTVAFEDNSSTRDAIADGEIEVGLINHYYVAQAREEAGGDYPVDVHFPPGGDAGSLVNVAGAGILESSERPDAARELVEFLLSPDSQEYFASETKEYPLVEGVKADPEIVPLEEIEHPDIDLSNLSDLDATLKQIERSGAL